MSQLFQTPRGGLEHRVFASAGPLDQLVAVYAFEPPLDEGQLARAQAELDRWSESAAREDLEEPCHCDEPFLSPRTLRVKVHNLLRPREELTRLTDALSAGLPVRERHFARWVPVPARQELALALDPEAPEEVTNFPRHSDYLRAVFDFDAPPPASEYESQGKGAFETRTGDIVLEERGIPLHLPPLRIAYGTAQARFTPLDARARAVRDALTAALQRAFAPLAGARVPTFFDHGGKPGEVDRLEVSGRVGYGFGIASPELIQRISAMRFRYREPELFEALVPLVGELGLAPVVTWQRFGKPFAKEWKAVEIHVFQLWEPGPKLA